MTQTTFDTTLFRSKRNRAKHGPKLASRMIAILTVNAKRNGGWMKRREFAERYGFSADGRDCRLGRECSHGRILASQRGYKLARLATQNEGAEALARIRKQIDAEREQYRLLCMRLHRAVYVGDKAMR